MALENLQERLAELDDLFNGTKPAEGGGFSQPPLGEHECLVDSWDWFESKDGGKAFLKLVTKIDAGEHGGKQVEILYTISDPDRWPWLKKDLEVLGVKDGTYKLSDLVPGSPVLAPTLDTPVLMKVIEDKKGRTNDAGEVYRNVYLQQRLGEPGAGAGGFTPRSDVPNDFPAQGALDDDDIPF